MHTTYLLQTDTQCSTLGGVGLAARAYGPYGALAEAAGPLQGFAGQSRDAVTGCYHLGNGHRLFNPLLMRFHSPDRLSPFDEGGLNAYAYCLGDPVNRTDPSGRVPALIGPTLGAMTNSLGLLATGLKARTLYKVHKTYRPVQGLGGSRQGWVATGTIDTEPARKSALEIGVSVLSGVTGMIGLVTSIWRFFDKSSDEVAYTGFGASAISILTTGYEIYSLAGSKPWQRYPIALESFALRRRSSAQMPSPASGRRASPSESADQRNTIRQSSTTSTLS